MDRKKGTEQKSKLRNQIDEAVKATGTLLKERHDPFFFFFFLMSRVELKLLNVSHSESTLSYLGSLVLHVCGSTSNQKQDFNNLASQRKKQVQEEHLNKVQNITRVTASPFL